MVETSVSIHFASELCKVKEVLGTIIFYMEDQLPYISDDDLFDLRLIYNELLVNAVIHGNKQDLSKEVHIVVEVDRDDVWSVIRDEGPGFNYSDLLNSEEPPDDLFSESGRGIWLVKSLTDALVFNHAGNEIAFYKKVHCMNCC